MLAQINKIKIGKRLRVDHGDVEGLANSIKQHGLLHPIVIDSEYNLVAGCRRLLATERLGLQEIEVKMLNDLSEKELRILELEENIQRKDLTEIEKSRNLVELAEVTADVIRDEQEVGLESGHTNNGDTMEDIRCPKLGHLENGNIIGLRPVADKLGIPRQTINYAQQHVKAVDKYPELAELPKIKAIETAKALDNNPKLAEFPVIDLAKQRKLKNPDSEMNSSEFSAYLEWCHKVYLSHHKAIVTPAAIDVTPEHLATWKEITQDSIPMYLRDIPTAIAKLAKIEKYLKEISK